jgi:hypothetical protein
VYRAERRKKTKQKCFQGFDDPLPLEYLISAVDGV